MQPHEEPGRRRREENARQTRLTARLLVVIGGLVALVAIVLVYRYLLPR